MVLILSIVVLSLCSVSKVTAYHEYCPYATDLSYASLRDQNVVTDSSPICDYQLVRGWYRVKHRTMVNRPPMLGRCGTTYPVWLNGSDPVSINSTEQLVACQVGLFGPCQTSYEIMATRCSENDVVYYLKEVSSCNAAYCFERNDYCVEETVNDVKVMYHNTTWKEENNYADFYDPILNFRCEFALLNLTDLFYDITWYAGDHFIKKVIVKKSELDQTMLTSKDMLSINKKMGEKIRCVVGAKKSKDDITCLTKTSFPFTVGFEVLNKTITLQRNGSGEIHIKQTAPYVVRTPTTQRVPSNIPLIIKTKFKNSTKLDCHKGTLHSSKCEAHVYGYDYLFFKFSEENVSWNITHKISISSLDPLDYYITNQRLLLSLGTEIVADGNKFFSDVDLQDIHINVVDDIDSWKGKKCSSYADPHMTTFDGYPYECQKGGCESGKTYIMYENAQHNQEVQVRHGSCWGRPQCVCALAARAGRDVFIIDLCNGQEFIDFPQCDDRSLEVHRDADLTYRIVFHTGTTVKAYLYDSWYSDTGRFFYINIEIFPTVADVNTTLGLCGYLDDDQKNDLTRSTGDKDNIDLYDYYNRHPDAFSKSWRITDISKDLLSRNNDVFEILVSLETYTQKLCHCDHQNGTVCSYQHYKTCKTTQWGPNLPCDLHTSNRKKRDVKRFGEQNQNQNIYPLKASMRQKRQATKTPDEAKSLCETAFQRSAHYDTCLQNIPNFSNETLINCINDIIMTGNENLTELHVETALNQCKEYISYNSSLQTEKSDIVIAIIALCPKNCSNNGNCFNGICTCEKGYGGSDCSFDLTEPPTISRISGAGICDKTLENCDEILIYGRYFVRNPNASCFMMRKEVDANGTILNDESITVDLNEKTLFEAACALIYEASESWLTEFALSVTNDGEKYTETYNVYVYQSQCQTLKNESGIITVTLQSGYCYINGRCIQREAFQSNDSCLLCKPRIDSFNWTNCNAQETSDVSQIGGLTTETIGLIVGVIVVTLLILVTVGYLIKSKTMKGKINKTSTVNSRNVGDVVEFPDNKKIISWKGQFNSADLFQFDSQADKYSRPPSALSNRALPPTNDLSSVFDQKKLDMLFTVKS